MEIKRFKLTVVTEKRPVGNPGVDPACRFHHLEIRRFAQVLALQTQTGGRRRGGGGLFGWFDVRRQVLLITHSCLQLLL